ncbi:MAG TPA: hypothetical protein VE866_01890 [Candidatus Binatia bacterium]|nr:hypothetical protein [Candidatus Binatia bacterium]
MKNPAARISHFENLMWRIFSLVLFVIGLSIAIAAFKAGMMHLDDPMAYVILLAFIGWSVAVGSLLRWSFVATSVSQPEPIPVEVRNGPIRF